MSYNSYLIKDEKNVVLDTIDKKSNRYLDKRIRRCVRWRTGRLQSKK